MARAGIYKSEVVRARNNLLAMGRYPSIDAIRGELGNTGSKGTIHRYLKEIEEEEGGSTGTQVAVSEAIRICLPGWPNACMRKPISAWRH
jgi:hypothetical protein